MLKGVKTYLKYASMPSITHISKFLSVLPTILPVTEMREASFLINTVSAEREIQNKIISIRADSRAKKIFLGIPIRWSELKNVRIVINSDDLMVMKICIVMKVGDK